MLNKQQSKLSTDQSLSLCGTYLVKLYLSSTLSVELPIYSQSDVDAVIREVIDKYGLKQAAYGFLKGQIQGFIQKVGASQQNSQVMGQSKQSVTSDLSGKSPLAKRQNFVLRDIKLQDIDKNRVTVQRTPKNSDSNAFRKQKIFKETLRTQPGKNTKSSLGSIKKTNKENKSSLHSFQETVLGSFKKQKQFYENLFSKGTKSKNQSKQDSLVVHNIELDQSSSQGSFLSSNTIQKMGLCQPKKVKTEADLNMSYKQFSIDDLQNQMREQLVDLKYERKVKGLQEQLRDLFNSIIRYNPPKVNKIDTRYACFEDLSQKDIKILHSFLLNLTSEQMTVLDLDNFKKFIVKYRCEDLLNSLANQASSK